VWTVATAPSRATQCVTASRAASLGTMVEAATILPGTSGKTGRRANSGHRSDAGAVESPSFQCFRRIASVWD
jgi:hypothetical protein